MAKRIPTDYASPIEIGTKDDDARLDPTSVYISLGDRNRMTLSPSQALHLASAILETVRELPLMNQS